MMVKEKQRVVIVSIYDEANLDLSVKKEEQLKRYCESKGYEIISICRDHLCDYSCYHMTKYLIDKYIHSKHISKVLIYSLDEIDGTYEETAMMISMLNSINVDFETIEEGTLGEDFVCFSRFGKIKNAYEKNKEFFISENNSSEELPF